MSDPWVGEGDIARPVRRRDVGEASSIAGMVLSLLVAVVAVAVVFFARLMGWNSPDNRGARLAIVAGCVGVGFLVVVVWYIWLTVSERRPPRQHRDEYSRYSLVEERARLERLAGKRVDGGVLGADLAASVTVWAAGGGADGSQVAAVNRWLVTSSARLDFEAVLVDVVAGRRLLEMPLFYERSQLGAVRREARLEPGGD